MIQNHDVVSLADNRVAMSNALIRAGHGLTLSEKRIVIASVSKLDSRRTSPYSILRTRLSAAEYAETYRVDANTAYDQLRAAAAHLYNRTITFFQQASDRRRRKRGGSEPLIKTQMRWVGSVKYHEGEGWVELSWWPDLLPHLVGLRKQFTTYQLEQATALRHTYSWRLLELLTRFESSGYAEYELEDFCVSMDVPPSYKNFAHIRTKVIEPAVEELEGKDGWQIDWLPKKQGRRVVALGFRFRRNPQGSLF